MKIAALPFCAIAFTGLSIAHVALAHFNVIALSPAWLVLTSYSAVIAAAAWLDKRPTATQWNGLPLLSRAEFNGLGAQVNFGGAHGTAKQA